MYDVIIVGGGMVGSALGCALGQYSDLKVVVLEHALPDEMDASTPPELRVSAITKASQNVLSAVGAWQGIVDRRVSPYSHMTVWDASGEGEIEFDAGDVSETELGYIIENRVIQLALLERLGELEHVELRAPASVSHVQWDEDGASVQLENGETLHGKLIVAADGARSRVREMAGIKGKGWSYEQHGLVCAVRTEHPHQETAWQRFQDEGPLAFLPLSDGRCSIVWSTSPARATALEALSKTEFSRQLEHAFGGRLGAITEVGPRAAFPLRLMNAERYVMPRLVLVGDAAHNIHPLAGQGVNLGFMDVASLAEVLLQERAKNPNADLDLGQLSILRKYERWRKGETLLMMGAMDGLKRLFSSQLTPLRMLRNVGLSLTNSSGPLKKLLTRRAMGLDGELPRLARGKSPLF